MHVYVAVCMQNVSYRFFIHQESKFKSIASDAVIYHHSEFLERSSTKTQRKHSLFFPESTLWSISYWNYQKIEEYSLELGNFFLLFVYGKFHWTETVLVSQNLHLKKALSEVLQMKLQYWELIKYFVSYIIWISFTFLLLFHKRK